MVADAQPIYQLYALPFADRGLSTGPISTLFAICRPWHSSSKCLQARSPIDSRGVAHWSQPGSCNQPATRCGYCYLDSRAAQAGFVLRGIGGALVSGALEALIYDGLVTVGAEDQFGRLLGQVTAAEARQPIPAAVGAAGLFSLGRYPLVRGRAWATAWLPPDWPPDCRGAP